MSGCLDALRIGILEEIAWVSRIGKRSGIQDSGFGIEDSGLGTWDSGFGIRDLGFGIRDSGI